MSCRCFVLFCTFRCLMTTFPREEVTNFPFIPLCLEQGLVRGAQVGKCSERRARPRGRWASLWGPSRPPKSRLPHSSIRLPDGKLNSLEASSVTGTITSQTQARRFILAEHKCKEGALGEREGGEPGGGSRRGTWMKPRICPCSPGESAA